MAERKDLRVIDGYSRFDVRPVYRGVSDAELLDLLLPDIDWEALREALSVPHYPIEDGSAFTYRVDAVTDFIDGTARRLLALHDGKDG